jgi:hypothetical protein
MSAEADIHAEAERIRGLHEARVTAELAKAESYAPGCDSCSWRGSLMPTVSVVKGMSGPAEASGGSAVSGADGKAAVKALEALGHDGSQVFFTLSRPVPGVERSALCKRLRAQLEAVDAPLIVALDAEAAEDIAEAYGLASLAFGDEVRVAGRRLVAIDGLEASLADPLRKGRVWAQFSAARRQGSVF